MPSFRIVNNLKLVLPNNYFLCNLNYTTLYNSASTCNSVMLLKSNLIYSMPKPMTQFNTRLLWTRIDHAYGVAVWKLLCFKQKKFFHYLKQKKNTCRIRRLSEGLFSGYYIVVSSRSVSFLQKTWNAPCSSAHRYCSEQMGPTGVNIVQISNLSNLFANRNTFSWAKQT